MRRRSLYFAFCFFFFFSVRAEATLIPVVGMSSDGSTQTAFYSMEDYVEGTARMIASTVEEVSPELERRSREKSAWSLQWFEIGITLGFSVGFPPFFTFGLAPGFFVDFSRKEEWEAGR